MYVINTSRIYHFDFKVSRSQAKIDESFANYFLKTKANYRVYSAKIYNVKGYRKA